MLRKLEYACLVSSLALISADRVDLAAGHLPFVLTPFLVVAPLTVVLHVLGTSPDKLLNFSITPPVRRQIPFLAAGSVFIACAFGSVPLGLDPARGAVAFCDLLIVALLGYFISFLVLNEPDTQKLVRQSVVMAIAIYIFFCVGECIAWSKGYIMDIDRSGSWLQSTFAPGTLGPWVPNLSGTTLDPNRAGFDLIMFQILLDQFVRRSRLTKILRAIIGVLVVLCFSRSATLCWFAYYLFSKRFWLPLRSRKVQASLVAVAILCSAVFVVYQQQIVNLLDLWEVTDAVTTKLSMDPGSSGESHILLIQRGLDTWLTSPKTIITGIGYAAAPQVLEDFFGSDKHGNFHSLYVTALAEMGLPAFLAIMFCLCYPAVKRKGALRGIAAIMIFNVGYQTHTEPLFWLMLAILWAGERRVSRKRREIYDGVHLEGPGPSFLTQP